eukprot:scaffold60418_cov56-Phaeocystis_antarctica.AAC.4
MATKRLCVGAMKLFALEYPTNRFRDFALRWQPARVAFRSLIIAPASGIRGCAKGRTDPKKGRSARQR